jgi:hypothetical protein
MIIREMGCSGDSGLLEDGDVTSISLQLAVRGLFASSSPPLQTFIKGHLLTRELDVLQREGLSTLQDALGDQLVRFEIGGSEGKVSVQETLVLKCESSWSSSLVHPDVCADFCLDLTRNLCSGPANKNLVVAAGEVFGNSATTAISW